MTITHAKVSILADGSNADQVQPTNWNEAHVIADKTIAYAKIQDVSATDKLLGRSTAGAGVVEEIACTAAGRAILDDVDAAAQRTTLGAVGTARSIATTAPLSGGGDLSGDRTLSIQVSATDKLLGRSTAGAGVAEEIACTAAGRALLDDVDAAAQLTTLGVTAAAQTILDDVSTAAILATLGGAPLAAPTFTGVPAAPTAAPGTNTTQVATTAFVTAAVAGGGGGVVRYAVPCTWSRDDLTAGLTNQRIDARGGPSAGGAGGNYWVPPRAGSIVGISCNLSNNVSAGNLTINVDLDYTPIALALAATGFGGHVTQAAGVDTYVANQRIGVLVTTDGAYAPGTLDLDVWIYVEEAP